MDNTITTYRLIAEKELFTGQYANGKHWAEIRNVYKAHTVSTDSQEVKLYLVEKTTRDAIILWHRLNCTKGYQVGFEPILLVEGREEHATPKGNVTNYYITLQKNPKSFRNVKKHIDMWEGIIKQAKSLI